MVRRPSSRPVSPLYCAPLDAPMHLVPRRSYALPLVPWFRDLVIWTNAQRAPVLARFAKQFGTDSCSTGWTAGTNG